MLDLIIVGAGPAGLAAAIYAARAELNFIVLEKEIMSGGIRITYELHMESFYPNSLDFRNRKSRTLFPI